MSHTGSHSDFDVVTGPSMPHRPVPAPQRPSPSPETAAEPAAQHQTPADAPGDTDGKGR